MVYAYKPDYMDNMPRYRKLLIDLVDEHGLRPGARILRTSAQSLSDWLAGTEPRLEALEKISRHFFIPVPALLLDQGDDSELNDRIIAGLYKLDADRKQQVADLITRLLSSTGRACESA